MCVERAIGRVTAGRAERARGGVLWVVVVVVWLPAPMVISHSVVCVRLFVSDILRLQCEFLVLFVKIGMHGTVRICFQYVTLAGHRDHFRAADVSVRGCARVDVSPFRCACMRVQKRRPKSRHNQSSLCAECVPTCVHS